MPRAADAITPDAGRDNEACRNCGHAPVGAWCSVCGQRTWRRRFTLPDLLRRAMDEGLNWDRGFFFTVRRLTRQPGHSIREYLSGRTRPYTSPVRYLLVAAVLATLAFRLSGLGDLQPMIYAENPESTRFLVENRLLDWNRRYFNLILIGSVPVLAVMSWLLFWPSRRTLAEHFVFNLYVFAHQNLFFVVTVPVYLVVDRGHAEYMLVYLGLCTLYYAYAAVGTFRSGPIWTLLRSVLLTVISYVTYMVIFVALAMLMVSYAGR